MSGHNSIIASGLAKYGYKELAGRIFMALLDLSSMVDLHRLPELFCGITGVGEKAQHFIPWLARPRPGRGRSFFLILQACLGISIDAERKRIVFDDPYLPEGIPTLAIKDLRCGGITVDLFLERRENSVLVHKGNTQSAIEIVTIVS